MKFFTPELLQRFRSEDDAVATQSSKEWDLAIENYRKLNHLQDEKNLHDANLHDAKIQSIYQKDRLLTILLTPDNEDQLYELQYCLTEEPETIHHSSDGSPCFGFWLYDEFDLSYCYANPPRIHSILFTGLVELKICFASFKFTKVKSII